MKMFIAVAGAIVLASPVGAQECTQTQHDVTLMLAGIARDCVRNAAIKLERSGETASDIATAALETCRPEMRHIRADCSGDGSRQVAFTEAFRAEALKVVVETRASKR